MSNSINRYAAKLFFQFRVALGRRDGKRRLCEERIVVFNADTPRLALTMAKERGKQLEHNFENNEGNTVWFEFIGVMDLLRLGVECDDDEVWYEICERVTPMERKDVFIPRDSQLIENRADRSQKKNE